MREGIRQQRVQPKITMQRVPAQIDKQITATPEASPFYKPFAQFPATIPDLVQRAFDRGPLPVELVSLPVAPVAVAPYE